MKHLYAVLFVAIFAAVTIGGLGSKPGISILSGNNVTINTTNTSK